MDSMVEFMYKNIIDARKKSLFAAQSKYNEYFLFKKSWLQYQDEVDELLIKNNYKDCIPNRK